jgi:hypothetical protein
MLSSSGPIPSSSVDPGLEPFLKSLKKKQIGEDDPAIVIAWHQNVVETLVAALNRLSLRPPFATFPVGQCSVELFESDVVSQLAAYSGGRYFNVGLAPNTFSQVTNVTNELARIEIDSVLQEAAQDLPENVYLATLFYCTDRSGNLHLLSLAGSSSGRRQLFR